MLSCLLVEKAECRELIKKINKYAGFCGGSSILSA